MKTEVVIKTLKALHQKESFTNFKPLNNKLVNEIKICVKDIFDRLGGASLLKSSREVYIKPNAVNSKAYSFTRVEVLREIIEYWKKNGAKKIFLFENATQGNYTRLVYHGTGYMQLCRQTGTVPIFLDEEKSEPLNFTGKEKQSENNPDGYELTSFEMPDKDVINSITGKGLIAGNCGIKEVSQTLLTHLGKKNVYLSSECNNLCDTANALFHLMKVNPVKYVPGNPVTSFFVLMMAKIKGSTSQVPSPFAHIFKMV